MNGTKIPLRTRLTNQRKAATYIWGGPNDTDEVLQSEFHEIISEDFLTQIGGELEEECGTDEWASIPGREDFDLDLDYVVSDFYPRFERSVEVVRRLLGEKINENEQAHFSHYCM